MREIADVTRDVCGGPWGRARGAASGLAALGFALVLAAPARALPDPGQDTTVFDTPLATKVVGPTSDAADDAVGCTWYPDLMVREAGVHSYFPGPSAVVAESGGTRAPCPGRPGRSDVRLPTQGRAFIGRKGPFLFYELAGDVPSDNFQVWYWQTAKNLYEDVTDSVSVTDPKTGHTTGLPSFRAATIEQGALHLTFTRFYIAQCSLLTEGAGCWRKSMADGHFARAIAAQSPPTAACTAAYRAKKVPTNTPSAIYYEASIQLTAEGKLTVLSRGEVGCVPHEE